jgi:hypothetical protein
MSQYLDQRLGAWVGRTLVDRAGQRIGRVEDLYTDDVSGHPAWIAVATGRFGLNITFLPLAGATPLGGDELKVQFSRNQIKEAPIAGRNGRLAPDEVIRLYDHYGFDLEAEEIRERAIQARPSASPVVERQPPPPVADRPAAAAVTDLLTQTAVMDRPAPPPPATRRAAPAPGQARPSEAAAQARQAAVKDRLSQALAAERQEAVEDKVPEPLAQERRAAVTGRLSQLAATERPAPPAPKDEAPRRSPDNPLFWDHDDRIDSIRPPANWRPKARR